jgi:glycosyltransferase involved in cell wall biosynthesis
VPKTLLTVKMQAIDLTGQRLISNIEYADVLVGIPSYNNAKTIDHVIVESAEGLQRYFGDEKCIILISDGGSADRTVQIANDTRLPRNVKLVTCRYQGVPGKGSAIRAVFEAAVCLNVKSVVMVDSDLESITPSWIKLLVDPTLHHVGLVAPRYNRHKFDGTITNQLCYPLMRALYGKRVRQPIGGDFGLSAKLVKRLIESPLWRSPYIPRFGIDIFITSSAIAQGFSVEEADLGVKIHAAKDPAFHLASMFREVAGSTLTCMEMYQDYWKRIGNSVSVALHRNETARREPASVNVSMDRLLEQFRRTYFESRRFRSMLSFNLQRELDTVASTVSEKIIVSLEVWARTVYEVAAKFRRSDDVTRDLLLEGLRSVWTGRVATFVRETISMSNEETEKKVEEDAMHFERTKSELLAIY